VVARSGTYSEFVAERIRWYGLPEELIFLPVIESEWSPHAVSRSGAAGLWQFMRNSIAGYDMRVDEWVDERRDFMKSTDAALRKLRDNYETLGSWEMAIAAYNCGLGAASRAAVRGGNAGFLGTERPGAPALPDRIVRAQIPGRGLLLSRGARNGFPPSRRAFPVLGHRRAG
jgi:membrane-bound lytic murein transglycosylase D